MFNKRQTEIPQEKQKELKDPTTYHREILLRLGKKFVSTNVVLPDEACVELGIHFIKLLKQQPTEFSPELKTALYLAHLPKSSSGFNSCGFTFQSSKEMEDLLAKQILDLMTINTGTMGFQQMRIVLEVAEEVNPTNIKNVKYFVGAKLLKGQFVETANLIIDKLDAANTLLFQINSSQNSPL